MKIKLLKADPKVRFWTGLPDYAQVRPVHKLWLCGWRGCSADAHVICVFREVLALWRRKMADPVRVGRALRGAMG
jgi:hypothetical protein